MSTPEGAFEASSGGLMALYAEIDEAETVEHAIEIIESAQRKRIADYWQRESDEHQRMAEQRHDEARRGGGSLYHSRMKSAKAHRTIASTYARVAREIRGEAE